MKNAIKELCPPILLKAAIIVRNKMRECHLLKNEGSIVRAKSNDVDQQDLDMYWDHNFADILETWGEGNVWNEISYLMVCCSGRVLDVACGTGKVMQLLSEYRQLDLYGCDISDMLINKAIERGMGQDKLTVCDATKMSYESNSFDYAYSIGSLEHFTEDGITKCIGECFRISRIGSFHMVPISESGRDEGWITLGQSWHNNSVAWWLSKFRSVYPTVSVLDSSWRGGDSFVGKWFICFNK